MDTPTSASVAHVRPLVDLRWFVPAVGWLLAVGLALRFFTATQYLLLGLLGAGCLASLLGPVARAIPGPRWLGAVVAGLLPWIVLGGLGVLLVWTLGHALTDQLADWPQIRDGANAMLGKLGTTLGLSDPLTLQDLATEAQDALTGSGGRKLFATGASIATGSMIALAFLLFGSIFLLGEHDDRLLRPVLSMLPLDRRGQVAGAVADLVPKLRWWLFGTMISMTVIGVATGLGYALVGLHLAIPLALFAGLAEIVPTFGPFAAFLLAILLAATQGPGTMLGVTGVYVVIQLLETHVLTPLVMRKAVDVPPLVTLFTVVFWGQVFGPAGLLLAIPLDLTVWSFADRMLIEPRRALWTPQPSPGTTTS